MRLAVYTDYAYHRVGEEVYAERAFALFLAALARKVDRMVIAGRLSPEPSKARYSLGDVDFVALPYYRSLAEPHRALPAMFRSLRVLWRAIGEVDAIWVMGPHVLAFPIALFATVRRKSVVLGARQEYLEYVRSRHPGRRAIQLAARLLDAGFRGLARLFSVIAVGPRLAQIYARAPRLLEISVSLIDRDDVVSVEAAMARTYGEDEELHALSVGRLEKEKDPLLLADVLARTDSRWRLIVCGEGPLEGALRDRFAELGLTDRVELRGYVPHDQGLAELYRTSDALLHISRTEGLPQVLFEAFAAGLPVVASDVGGIREAVGDAVLLFAPGDAPAAATRLEELAGDSGPRSRLLERAHAIAESHTLDGETARIAEFVFPQAGEPWRRPNAPS